MTRSNRILNRGILLLLGLVAVAAAAVLALPLLPETVRPFRAASLTASTTLDWFVAVAAAAVIVLAIAWIATRGRGRVHLAVQGESEIDARVVADLLRDALSREPEVVAASAAAYRVRGRTALRLRVEVRRSADLRRIVDAVRTAVDDLDRAIGTAPSDRLAVLVHITTGLRASFAREQRVA